MAKYIGIVSDTHGYIDEPILDALAGCDLCLHAGDIGNGEVIRQIRTKVSHVGFVLGNNDTVAKWPSQDRAGLKTIPEALRLEIEGGVVCVIHGHQFSNAANRHIFLRKRFPQSKLIVYGHSHRLVCDQALEPWVVNPGAAGKSRTFGGPSLLRVKLTSRAWHIETFKFDLKK